MNSWVALVGKQGCKLYPARTLYCYKAWPIHKVLQLNKSSCEVALTMITNRQARAGLNVAADLNHAAKGSPFSKDHGMSPCWCLVGSLAETVTVVARINTLMLCLRCRRQAHLPHTVPQPHACEAHS